MHNYVSQIKGGISSHLPLGPLKLMKNSVNKTGIKTFKNPSMKLK